MPNKKDLEEMNRIRNQCFDICYGNVHGFYGNIMLYQKVGYKNKRMEHRININVDKYEEIKDFDFNKGEDIYITPNSFYKYKYLRRTKKMTAAFNNLVIDIDNHEEECDFGYVQEHCNLLIKVLFNDVFDLGLLPSPNIIHFTGRGMQIWWHIEQASSKLSKWHLSAIENLVYAIKNRIDEYNIDLSVDLPASKNYAGLFRAFCTKNSKTERYSSVIIVKKDSCILQDISKSRKKLKEELDLFPSEKKVNNTKKKSKKNKKKSRNNKKNGWLLLSEKRIKFIEKVVKERDYEVNNRDKLLFAYYNELAKAYPNDIPLCKQRTLDLNNSFHTPTEVKDIEKQIFSYIDSKASKNYLHMKTNTFFEFVIEDEEEKNIYKSISNKKREVEAKRKKEQKKNKTEELLENIKILRSNGYTWDNICRELKTTPYYIRMALK